MKSAIGTTLAEKALPQKGNLTSWTPINCRPKIFAPTGLGGLLDRGDLHDAIPQHRARPTAPPGKSLLPRLALPRLSPTIRGRSHSARAARKLFMDLWRMSLSLWNLGFAGGKVCDILKSTRKAQAPLALHKGQSPPTPSSSLEHLAKESAKESSGEALLHAWTLCLPACQSLFLLCQSLAK